MSTHYKKIIVFVVDEEAKQIEEETSMGRRDDVEVKISPHICSKFKTKRYTKFVKENTDESVFSVFEAKKIKNFMVNLALEMDIAGGFNMSNYNFNYDSMSIAQLIAYLGGTHGINFKNKYDLETIKDISV